MNVKYAEGKNAVAWYLAGALIGSVGTFHNFHRGAMGWAAYNATGAIFCAWRIVQIGRGKKWEAK